MRRRRRRGKDFGLSESMDSFLDIVTNTLGLLILISALTIITARDIKISLGTPIMAPAPKEKKRVLFECRDNRILPVEEEYCKSDVENILESDDSISRKNQMVRELDDREMTNGYHRYAFRAVDVRLRSGRRSVLARLTLESLDEKVGDTISMLRRPEAEYNKRLSGLNPDKHWVCFIVREDSFEALRVARKIAKKQGFQVGWDPFESHLKIRFSSGGGKGDKID